VATRQAGFLNDAKPPRKRRRRAIVLAAVVLVGVAAWQVDFVRQDVRFVWEQVFGAKMAGTTELRSFDSRALHEKRSYYIYLPPSYSRRQRAGERYPVYYCLHGMPWGKALDWLRYGRIDRQTDEMIRRKQIAELILIIPSGRGKGFQGDSEYVNARNGSCDMADFLVHDLVEHVDRTYRTIPDKWHRGIGGISAGGFGGINLGLKHPDVFGLLVSSSGVYRAERDSRSPGIWGTDKEFLRRNSPLDYLGSVPLPDVRVYLDVGIRGREIRYIRETRQLRDLLTRRHLPHEYHEWDSGSHTWDTWRSHVPDVLRFLSANWGRNPGGRQAEARQPGLRRWVAAAGAPPAPTTRPALSPPTSSRGGSLPRRAVSPSAC